MDRRPIRYDINRMVQTILAKHAADMTKLQFSCSGSTVYLQGALIKTPAGDFTPLEIQALVKDIEAMPHRQSVQVTLSNWNVSYQGSGLVITPKKDVGYQKLDAPDRLHVISDEDLKKSVS